MTASDFICGVFFIFSIIKNFHHEKGRFVRKKSTSGKPALGVDKDFKEGSDVVIEVASEHVNNLSIALSYRTANDVKVAGTIQIEIEITSFSTIKKLIIITGYIIRFVNSLKGTLKNDNTNVLLEKTLTINEYNNALNLWIKSE